MVQSAAWVGTSQIIRRTTGLRTTKLPLRIETQAGVFRVGENDHDQGRPAENLHLDPSTGVHQSLALLSGAVALYSVPDDPATTNLC